VGCTVIVGGFFGDEGKGKIVSHLALNDKPSIVARAGVGPNAGHTVEYRGKRYSLRLLPCGFVYDKARLLIGSGVAVNPKVILQELELTDAKLRFGLDYQCAVIEQKHIDQESQSEHLSKTVGSTKSGVGACNAARAMRTAKLAKDVPEFSPYLREVDVEINSALQNGEGVIIEGTQGTFLSLYHGTYPYCTSKDTTASAACADVGIGPTAVTDVVIIFKAYVTRVGSGPLVGELSSEETRGRGWQEFGTVTGRERRAAPFNFDLARRAVHLNGATQVAITKLDVVFPESKAITDFIGLPGPAREFIFDVERNVGVPVTLIGTGPAADDIIDRRTRV
jgi:adenylosuccinate synthase